MTFLDQLTENDRGTFIVRTQTSEHTWEIEEDGTVYVTRQSSQHNPYGLDMINGRRNWVTRVEMWPVVGMPFLYHMNGDIPWTRSSRIREIEKIA